MNNPVSTGFKFAFGFIGASVLISSVTLLPFALGSNGGIDVTGGIIATGLCWFVVGVVALIYYACTQPGKWFKN